MTDKQVMNKKGMSVVLGSYNRLAFLKLTIKSIREEVDRTNFPMEIIVVDGGSNDGSLEWLIKQKDVVTIAQHNRGQWLGKEIKRRSWGYFMNLGFKIAQGKYVCMVSDDCLLIPNSLKNGYNQFEKELKSGKKIGALAFFWRNWPEMKRYWVGYTLGGKIFVNHGMYLREALEEVDFIDEDTFTFYHADGDLCLKIWDKGYECIPADASYVEHYSHANMEVRKSNNQKQQQDWQNYLNKWEGKFYKGEKDEDLGEFIYKDFTDETNVAKMFNTLHLKSKILKKKDWKAISRNLIKKIINRK